MIRWWREKTGATNVSFTMPSLLLKPFSCTQLGADLLAGNPWVSSCAALLPALSIPQHLAAACAPLAPCRRRPLIL
jgi:hypothetical protein